MYIHTMYTHTHTHLHLDRVGHGVEVKLGSFSLSLPLPDHLPNPNITVSLPRVGDRTVIAIAIATILGLEDPGLSLLVEHAANCDGDHQS